MQHVHPQMKTVLIPQTNYAAAYDEMTSIQDYQGAAHIAKLL
jgi:hypothetical protein